MNYLAFLFLVVAMLCALGGSARCLLTLSLRNQKIDARKRGLALVEKANALLATCLILASIILLYGLATFDFSNVYIASYTDRVLPLFYRLTAAWAGQAGSMLFWAFSVALFGCFFQFTHAYKALSTDTRLWFWTFHLFIMSFFGLVLLTWNNPFIMYHMAPPDGNGLNPLLQNPGMIFHPPLLFLGYGGFVVPGCLALAQSMSGAQADEADWTDLSRPFIMSAWAFLTAGIVLGAWWAYMELGWGGYWAWDPVENASLIPWLTGTAALHTIVIQKRRSKLRGLNVFLMALTTISAFFATYLVRSGVVQSVHAFGTGGVGMPLLLFILFLFGLSLWIAWIAREKDAAELSGLVSREGMLVITSWLLLALACIVLIATMWPVFSVFWKESILGLTVEKTLDAAGHDHGGAVGLTAEFYNRVCMPLFAILTLLLAFCPWLGWNGGMRRGRQHLFTVLGVCIAAACGLYATGITHPVALLGAVGSIGSIVTMFLLFARKECWYRRGLSACGIHLGVALIGLGIAFSGPYKIESDPTLALGETAKVGQFEVRFTNLYEGQGPGYVFLEAELEVFENGKRLGIASPQRRIFSKWGQMQFAEAAVIPSLGHEFYASLLALDNQKRVVLRLSSNPLVNWLWVGGTLMCLLPFVALGGFRQTPIADSGVPVPDTESSSDTSPRTRSLNPQNLKKAGSERKNRSGRTNGRA